MWWRLANAASYLPNPLINWCVRHWKLRYDPTDGWTFWLDASYLKYCRKDARTK